MEIGVAGKILHYEIDEHKVLKIGNKHTDVFSQGCGVRQGCSFSPTLFNIYINELQRALEQSAAPKLPPLKSNVNCFLMICVQNSPNPIQQTM
jgi:hypothetical protein